MKKILIAAGLAVASLTAMAGTNVSVSIGQPGFYGRIDLGNAPPPAVIYPQPVVIQQPPVIVQHRPPIYLRVPPGHQKNWGRYCGRYSACGQPVYFVRDDWYRDHYRRPAPPPRVVVVDRRDRHDGHWHDRPRDDHRHDHRHDDRRRDDRRDDRGHHGGHGRHD